MPDPIIVIPIGVARPEVTRPMHAEVHLPTIRPVVLSPITRARERPRDHE
ncbi:hypothetical protein [Clavibacter sp. VKM Ac-2872]|nr:hypothetical protein [Clavibacter sp. VKM Ac-2872]MBF4625535.1 hypothetical protein [Clavibacter sp. VKM Ac-2872]